MTVFALFFVFFLIFLFCSKLKLRWCAIQSQGAKLLADGLGNSCMQSLEILDLMGNEIGVSGTRAIASLLAPGIDLDSFQVQDARSVLAAFENTTRIGCLKTLVLSYNCTSDAGCGYLGKAICISNTINRLELENCEIGDNGCKYLRRGIERNSTIRTLNIAANRYGDLGAREIQSFLLRNSSLEKLDISRNRLGPQRTMEIAKGLTMNRSLKVLRMNINRIGARGAQLLAKMLINNHTLQELELSYNEIFNDGVQVLAQGLVQNHGLRRLVLWYNGLEDAAARQLARALHQRSKAPHFRNDMVQAVAESQPDYFFINDRSGMVFFIFISFFFFLILLSFLFLFFIFSFVCACVESMWIYRKTKTTPRNVSNLRENSRFCANIYVF